VSGDDAGTPPPLVGVDASFVYDAGASDEIVVQPSVIDTNRFPASCGTPAPPYASGDLFSMDVVGAKTGPAPFNGLSISFTAPAPPVGQPLPLSVQPYTPKGSGIETPGGGTTWYGAQSASGYGITFQFDQGANPQEIDSGAFDAVVLTIVSMPARNGDPFAVRFQIHFVDGKVLDQTFMNAIGVVTSSCGAG
jgi:hypothetical protein